MTSQNNELLLKEDDNRYVMFPIVDKDIWKMYKKQVDCFLEGRRNRLIKRFGSF